MFHRKTLELPRGVVLPTQETEVVRAGKYTLQVLQQGEALHAHSGPLVGCTVMAAVATLDRGERAAYMQHYRSPEREAGFAQMEWVMGALRPPDGSAIVSMMVGVLSPRNKTKISTVGPWVTPMSGDERQRVIEAVSGAHPEATTAFVTYDLQHAQAVWDMPNQHVRMDLVVPEQGQPVITILD